MNIVCLVKMVPEVENFRYDYQRNVLVRDGAHQVINPEDETALATALTIKQEFPETYIETVTMAPRGAMPHLEDLVRRGIDRATLITDPVFSGSDTYVTSRILARYLESCNYSCVFCGTHTLDGGTSHVPAQVAESLGLAQMSNVVEVDHGMFDSGCVVVDVDTEDAILRFEIDLPAIFGFLYSTKRKLPYITHESLNLNVDDRIQIVTNTELGFERSDVGLIGSPTKVTSVEVIKLEEKNTSYVRVDDAGIEEVYDFLSRKGFLPS